MAKFRARARTVDMLGRQQIAGAPTAINELFKNAHDAYAKRVEVDYYRTESLFLLRDDGIGMTEHEFQDRWLTLGTESKTGEGGLPYRPPEAPERPIMGEKGIGRLAIARLGPQVLVMTRARRGEVLHDLVVSLVNWQLFELPGINLEEIEIPVRRYAAGEFPTREDIHEMAESVRQSLSSLANTTSPRALAYISKTLTEISIDPLKVNTFFNQENLRDSDEAPLGLLDDSCGTHFLIQPADTFLGTEIDDDQRSEDDPVFTKFLVGFANTMVPDAPPPRIKTRFRDWKTAETSTELIGGSQFLTPKDFQSADHHFRGRFDEYGVFEGTVSVYDQPPIRHVVAWENGEGHTLCGPFNLNFASLQGNQRESHLPPEEWAPLSAKLWRLGGIYVYRDGIRVLPYGNSDVDWLDIERNRTKSAYYYYFSYRKMLGAVELTREANGELVEKAGREGFQTNKAYRQFRDILKNFFVQIAADFFRDSGTRTHIYQERRAELERAELARRRREKLSGIRRKKFVERLETVFKELDEKQPEKEASELIGQVTRELEFAARERAPDRAAAIMIESEANANMRLDSLREKYRIIRPRDIGLGRQVTRDWEAYLRERERLDTELFTPIEIKIRELIGDVATRARLHLDKRRRLQAIVGKVADESQKIVRKQVAETSAKAENASKQVTDLARKAVSELQETITGVQADLQRLNVTDLDSTAFVDVQRDLEKRINSNARRQCDVLQRASESLLQVESTITGGDDFSEAEMAGALEEELLSIRDQADANAELVQLGMALAVVNHEFEAVIRGIRQELKRLSAWAKKNEGLRPIYEKIHDNFEHLDGYLSLFTPLQRRLQRREVLISGSDLEKFIQDLFGERLNRHSVQLSVTPEFRRYSVKGFPSTFYPVFVNLIDNAVFWLADRKQDRRITLDADQTGFLICNNGPAIHDRDRAAVFELGFTRKPTGRGMGLYISRQTLRRAGCDLTIIDHDQWRVCFKITTTNLIDETGSNGSNA
jgi:signal transduction histidine kinase